MTAVERRNFSSVVRVGEPNRGRGVSWCDCAKIQRELHNQSEQYGCLFVFLAEILGANVWLTENDVGSGVER